MASWAPDQVRRRLVHVLSLYPSRKYAADVAQKSVDQLQAYVKGRSSIPFEVLARLCLAKDVSMDWVATGTGEPQAGDGEGAAAGDSVPLDAEPLEHAEPEGYIAFPLHGPADAGGAGCGRHGGEGIAASREWVVRSLQCDPAHLVLVPVIGDAMQPTLWEGDLALVNTGQTSLRDGAIFVLDIAGEQLLKRVARRTDGGLCMICDNVRYRDEEVGATRAAQLRVVGRVVWAGTRL